MVHERSARIETRRLRLREIVEDDAAELFAIHGNADLMKWFGVDPLVDMEAARNLVKIFAGWRLQKNPGIRWGIEVKGNSRLIGSVGLMQWNRNWRSCTVGFELAGEAQNRGYMREALSTVLPWGFSTMQVNRIEAQVHPENLASLKLVRALGFVEEGLLRQVGYWRAQHHDMLQFSLLRSDWY